MVEDETNGYLTGGVTLPKSENVINDEKVRALLTSMLIQFGRGRFNYSDWVTLMRDGGYVTATGVIVAHEMKLYALLRNEDYMVIDDGKYCITDKAIEFINDHNI